MTVSNRALSAVLPLLLLNPAFVVADNAAPQVSLILSGVSTAKHSHDTLVRCDVTIDNETKNSLLVTSAFSSAFDGLELVVTDAKGKVLKQQPYTFHQSPSSQKGRVFELERGKTTATLVFSLSRFGEPGQSLRVRLVGVLPGSTYKRILSTETRDLEISEAEISKQSTSR